MPYLNNRLWWGRTKETIGQGITDTVPQEKNELLCIGNALVDIFSCASAEIAAHYGIVNPIQHIEIAKLKALLAELEYSSALPSEGCTSGYPPEKISSRGFSSLKISSGGGGANVAKVAGFLGAKVSFSGAVGSGSALGGKNEQAGGQGLYPDEFGCLFRDSLSRAGVELMLKIKPSPTGICLVLTTAEGENRIAASPSAALELSESDISEEDIKKAALVVVDGYLLSRPRLVKRILELAEKNGITAALDLGSPPIAEEYAASISGYAKRVSLILFMNEEEAGAFCRGMGKGDLRIANGESGTRKGMPLHEGICSYLESLTAGKKFPIIAVKLGGKGALCFSGGKVYRSETEEVVPAETTGAGDAFCAGFLCAWVRGKSIPECAAIGNKTARIVLDEEGTQAGREQFKSVAGLLS